MRSEPRRLARAAALVVSTVLALAGAELFLRWSRPGGPAGDARPLERQLAESEQSLPAGDERLSLRGLIRPSANPRLIYELKPGLRARFQGVPVQINLEGWRGAARTREKPRGTFRILGLGDSVMFGWGVLEEQAFASRLEAMLDAGGARHFEVLNLSVPGYNTMQEAELLESVGLAYAPDAVILCFVPNDDQLPNFIQRTDGSLFESSVLYKLLKRAGRKDPEEGVPPEYASMVGPEAVRQGLLRMAYLGRRHGFPVFVFCFRGHREISGQVRRWCEELEGLRFLDFDAYLERRGLSYGPELELSERDVHPNARFHEEIADFLHESLAGLQ